MDYITLGTNNIDSEHICCAFSDKKCSESYELKKQWLTGEFENGYIFRRLNERAKVFIEYGPAEKAWIPVTAPDYLMIGCFWVSGQYKRKGHGKSLLQSAIKDAEKNGKTGLITVAGIKKLNFMSDAEWLLKQGFEICEKISSGFCLLSMDLKKSVVKPFFNDSVKTGECGIKKGIVAYYSNRCPYSEYHVNVSLKETANKRHLPFKAIKLTTMEEAQSAPSPATIFSLFLDGKFVTTDLSVCMDSRFDKIVKKK
ncbi:MAG: YoaP domain-containing protein [Spirochaetes bacterium]|nr:YoaP domain-containing protein [Spirochaetota bacterium]